MFSTHTNKEWPWSVSTRDSRAALQNAKRNVPRIVFVIGGLGLQIAKRRSKIGHEEAVAPERLWRKAREAKALEAWLAPLQTPGVRAASALTAGLQRW
ncbi:hypothetical protein GN244_ATG05263 [Phytophthora infestans]|uniref:Uncharacterized protein n=1 Tax=Phytophthora infestans TaxID=4787 RepID=A0A833T9M1_PHYIN|nr:hypothetical protein GN244_ATG05263 [Phytophthora infestans]KAF4135146.1 hypothetical protein GN958_ATG15640 [Phytophthora infestans]